MGPKQRSPLGPPEVDTATTSELPAFIQAGAFISWDIRSATATVKLLTVGRYLIVYKCADGVTEGVHASCYATLADKVGSWRPATPGEIAAFLQREQPTDYISTRD